MQVNNFWTFLIGGLSDVLAWVATMLPLPFDDFQFLLSGLPTMLYFAIAPLVVFVGPFINLRVFVIAVTTVLLSEGARAVIGLWRLILRMIPAAG